MRPSDIIIKELDELEKDLLRVKRNNGAIYSENQSNNLNQRFSILSDPFQY